MEGNGIAGERMIKKGLSCEKPFSCYMTVFFG